MRSTKRINKRHGFGNGKPCRFPNNRCDRGLKMKKAILVLLVTLFSTSTFAAIKCERSPFGGTCCWDTRVDGPFRPLGC